jgi:hypothetical protein
VHNRRIGEQPGGRGQQREPEDADEHVHDVRRVGDAAIGRCDDEHDRAGQHAAAEHRREAHSGADPAPREVGEPAHEEQPVKGEITELERDRPDPGMPELHAEERDADRGERGSGVPPERGRGERREEHEPEVGAEVPERDPQGPGGERTHGIPDREHPRREIPERRSVPEGRHQRVADRGVDPERQQEAPHPVDDELTSTAMLERAEAERPGREEHRRHRRDDIGERRPRVRVPQHHASERERLQRVEEAVTIGGLRAERRHRRGDSDRVQARTGSLRNVAIVRGGR